MRSFGRLKANVCTLLLIIAVVMMTACGGGSSGSNPAPPPDNPDNTPDDTPNDPNDTPTPDPAPSMRVTVNSLNTDDCPDVKIYVSVYDDKNQVIENDPDLKIDVIEDGVKIENPNPTSTWLADAAAPVSVVLAMDYSLSMVNGDNSEAEMRAAVKEFVGLMKPEDKAAIIKFYYTPQIMVNLTSDQTALNSAIDAEPISNYYTNIYDTLYTAVDMLADETGPVAVILISDGGHAMTQVGEYLPPEDYAEQDGLTIDGHTKDEAISYAKNNNVKVFTIGYKSELKDHEEIKDIAAQTGGGYYLASDASALENIYGSLFFSLEGNQYQIVYASDTADALEHTISIEVEHNGMTGASDNLNFQLCPAP